ncbi:hypothetical protein [Falsiroseomonas sp. HW251]|uniref:hypothetical protein n=1 Tax=Falsiroseomonas sp. HW251 TaxID=3390998 RepID=UPI003D31A3E2
MLPIRAAWLLAAALAAGAAHAQAPAPAPGPAPSTATEACAAERARLAAEETTPGILRDLMQEDLRLCLAAAGQAAATAAGAGR